MKLTVLLFLLVSSSVFSQNVERILIDDFSNGAGAHGVSVALSADVTINDPAITNSAQFDAGSGCSGLLGCERDMSVTVFIGTQGRTFSSNIFATPPNYYFGGEWAVSYSKNSEAETILQYDGRDNSISLDLNGLGGIDLTDGGLVTDVRFSVIADLDLTYVLTAYSTDGSTCSIDIDVEAVSGPYSYSDTFVYSSISNFTGSCDLTNIGAIEVSIVSGDAIDTIVRQIAFVGLPDPSITPTQSFSTTSSRTLTSTVSQTPSKSGPGISVSATRTKLPTQSPTSQASQSSQASSSPSSTQSVEPTPSRTPSNSGSASPSFTSTSSASLSRGASPSSSVSLSSSTSFSPTVSVTQSPFPTCDGCSSEKVEISGGSVSVGTDVVSVSSENAFEEGQELAISTIPSSELDIPDSPGVSSTIVALQLFDSDGNPIQPEGEVEICLLSDEEQSDELCLAFINPNGFWECQDIALFPNDNGELCGFTDHFTVFSLMLIKDITPDPSTSPSGSPSPSLSLSSSPTPSPSPFFFSFTQTTTFSFVSTDIDDDDDVVVTVPDSFSFTQTIGDSTVYFSSLESKSNLISIPFVLMFILVSTLLFIFV